MEDYKDTEDMPQSVIEPDFGQIAFDLREAVFGRREPQTAKQILSGQNYKMVIKNPDGTLENVTRDGLCTKGNIAEFIKRNPNNQITTAFNHALHEGKDGVIDDFMATEGFKEFAVTHKKEILSEIKNCFSNGKDSALIKLLGNDNIKQLIETASNSEIFELALAVKEGAAQHPEAATIIREDHVLRSRIISLVKKANELADFMDVNLSAPIREPKDAGNLIQNGKNPTLGLP